MPGVVGYARVSTEEQAKENQSLPALNRRIELYCEQNSLQLLKVFEGSESARTAERIGLQQALDYCRANRSKISLHSNARPWSKLPFKLWTWSARGIREM
jgi:DNA invertase Pin-like site-specific DNA recombinase